MYWYIDMASDYAKTDETYVSIELYQTNIVDIVDNKLETIKQSMTDIQKRLEKIEIKEVMLVTKNMNPPILSNRYFIGVTLKANVTYRIELKYTIETGRFVGIQANVSNSGDPIDTVIWDLYKRNGEETIEYTPSVDVNYWYVTMASDYVKTDNTSIIVTVYGPENTENSNDNIVNNEVAFKCLSESNISLAANDEKSMAINYARAGSTTTFDINASGNFESIKVMYGSSSYIEINTTSIYSSTD